MMEENLNVKIQDFIKAGLQEDVREGDHTSLACIDPNATSKARLLVKSDTVLAGIELAKAIFTAVDPNHKFEQFMADGDRATYGDEAFYVTCNSQALLKAERLMLNSMQRMSGIASMSAAFAEEVKHTDVKVLDTRKTTPLIRFLEKWAVKIGGCHNYRFGLYDWIMIKDNHVDAAGGLKQALERVHNYQKKHSLHLGITVEVRSEEELQQALQVGGMTRVMFDNFTPEEVKKALDIVNHSYETEASGGINLSNVRPYAETGVEYVSSGALTHSVIAKDLSLKVMK